MCCVYFAGACELSFTAAFLCYSAGVERGTADNRVPISLSLGTLLFYNSFLSSKLVKFYCILCLLSATNHLHSQNPFYLSCPQIFKESHTHLSCRKSPDVGADDRIQKGPSNGRTCRPKVFWYWPSFQWVPFFGPFYCKFIFIFLFAGHLSF